MKKYLSVITIAFTMVGCSNKSEVEQSKQEVEVSLDYSFVESGNMSK